MIYNSIDVIPAKIYFKILETGNLALLSNKKKSIDKLSNVWNKIQEENDKVSQNKETTKILDLSKRVESISSKQKAIELAVSALKLNTNNKDIDLINLLTSRGYNLKDEEYLDFLNRVERENKSESVRIKRLEGQLPKNNESKESSSFDEVVINYGVITGSGFINTNKITLSQYYALIKIGNQKIKALENGEG